jgi:hypothetical protein
VILQKNYVDEMKRRVAWLPGEVSALVKAVACDHCQMGLHRTQAQALDVLMSQLWLRGNYLLREAERAEDADELAQDTVALLDEMAAQQEIWQVFRMAMTQHRDPALQPALDVADLVAARAYERCIDKARQWNALPGERTPPLVVLRASTSPAVYGRSRTLEALDTFGPGLRRYRDLMLPIPLVLLPADHLSVFWRHVLLFHEVGHAFDGDVAATAELRTRLGGLEARLGERSRAWHNWAAEIVADVIGTALGGAAFVTSLGTELICLGASVEHLEARARQPHPHPFVRLPLLLALLSRIGGPDELARAEPLRAAWIQRSRPEWVADYEADLEAIVPLFVDTSLDALGGHALRELGRDWPKLREPLSRLIDFVARGRESNRPPPHAGMLGLEHDLVPVAAELARLRPAAERDDLSQLHQRALDYASDDVPRPSFLAGAGVPGTDRVEYWKTLIQRLQGSAAKGETES